MSTVITPVPTVPRRAVRVRAVVCAALVAGLALAWWAALGPRALGGPADYVVTSGTSMLPSHRADGLVITRERDRYEVGDIVAYRDPELGAVVLHRIVDQQGDRFVLQGDNNDFLDRHRPTAGEIIGREWVHVPSVGRYLRALRDPRVFAAVVAGITLLSLRIPANTRRRRRHHAS